MQALFAQFSSTMPPPWQTKAFPHGRPDLRPAQAEKVQLGNLLLEISGVCTLIAGYHLLDHTAFSAALGGKPLAQLHAHLILRGRCKDKKIVTRLAEPYTRRLCSLLAVSVPAHKTWDGCGTTDRLPLDIARAHV